MVYYSGKGLLRLKGRQKDDIKLMHLDAIRYLYNEKNRNLVLQSPGEQPPFEEIAVNRLDLWKLRRRIRRLSALGRLDDLFA